MHLHNGEMRLSATDLGSHLGCRHLTALSLDVARNKLKKPFRREDPGLEALRQRGAQHERAYLDHLASQGRRIVELSPTADADADTKRTLAAMRAGDDVIAQGTLALDAWHGRPDVLMRVARPSTLGDWSYEVADTKLARETRGATILQLCLYSELVAKVQGVLPENMYVVTPRTGFTPETYRVQDFLAYYNVVRARLREQVTADPETGDTYPEPCALCDTCDWYKECDDRRRADDHLCLVAGVRKLQRNELAEWGVTTLSDLAALPVPIARKPSRGARESYERIREQARVQLEGRTTGAPVHELLPIEPEQGLLRLPAPSPQDVFFDFEGARYYGDTGLEYLFGYVTVDTGTPVFQDLWAFSLAEEKAAFETFIDAMMARWRADAGFHIYHYAPYETTAVKRLMSTYATREEEVDQMLCGGIFVDLHAVVRRALRASVEKYSIKDLERFYGYTREFDLRDAGRYRVQLEAALELGDLPSITDEMRAAVRLYNRDDCLSTMHLYHWLETLRQQQIDAGVDIPRPDPREIDPAAPLSEEQQRTVDLMARLTADVPVDRAERTPEQHARWLLAHMLEWHRREDKAVWWEFFRLRDLTDEELLDEREAISGLVFAETAGMVKRSYLQRYHFPPQEVSLRKGDELRTTGEESTVFGTIADIDLLACTVDIVQGPSRRDIHPHALFKHSSFNAKRQRDSLFALGTWVADHQVDADGFARAGRDLLLRNLPRLAGDSHDIRARPGEETLETAKRLALELDGGVLPIQGPPGCGKTYAGARMIVALAQAGKKVGITAISHKVIRNLLDEVVAAAEEAGVLVSCVQNVKGTPEETCPAIREVENNDEVLLTLQSGEASVGAGTLWLWSDAKLSESVDVLFVDEAGQMSLANVLAASPAARSIVLLGDPAQLEQPQKGCHPEGADVSALEHILERHETMPPERGLFLGDTWRLHPDICRYTSELFYEERLQSHPGTERQAIVGDTTIAGSGLWHIPVEHNGNQNHSPEEVARVGELVDELLAKNITWTDDHGASHPLTLDHILVVAPYNVQVNALADRLPAGARVGTVDKFQGQEAPVVIYSLTTSSPEDAPRGMEFLYSLNRLNVATSRARCACIVVACPDLMEPDCRTPRQMKLANALCRYAELAREI